MKTLKTRIEYALDHAVLYRDDYMNTLRRLRAHLERINAMIAEIDSILPVDDNAYCYNQYDECANALCEDIDYAKHRDIFRTIETDVDLCSHALSVAEEYTEKYLDVYGECLEEDGGTCLCSSSECPYGEDCPYNDDDEECDEECDEDDPNDFAPDDDEIDEEPQDDFLPHCRECSEFKEGNCEGITHEEPETKPVHVQQTYKKSGD